MRLSYGFLKEEILNENEVLIVFLEDFEIGEILNIFEGEEVIVREDKSSFFVYEMVMSFDKEVFEEFVID